MQKVIFLNIIKVGIWKLIVKFFKNASSSKSNVENMIKCSIVSFLLEVL